jgi:hypothetical protein
MANDPEIIAAYEELDHMIASAQRYNFGADWLYVPWINDCAAQATKLVRHFQETQQLKYWIVDIETRSRRPGGPKSLRNKFVGNHTVVILEPGGVPGSGLLSRKGLVPVVLDPWIGPKESCRILYGDPGDARRIDVMLKEDFIRQYPYDKHGVRASEKK